MLGLVSDHHAALLHHALLDCGRNAMQPFVVIGFVFGVPQTGRNVPEANVGKLRLFQYHFEAQSVLDALGEEMGVVHYFVDVVLEARRAFGFPHVPEFEDVGSSAALDMFVTSIISKTNRQCK